MENNYTINTKKLIKYLIKDGSLKELGTSDRYNDKYQDAFSNFNADNTYNYEFNVNQNYFTLSQDLEIRSLFIENLGLYILAISLHTGNDIRSGYTNEKLFISEIDLISEIQEITDSFSDGIEYDFISKH